MAAWFNKWLIVSIFPLITSFSQPIAAEHPFHVSVVEINHNAPDKTLEISCKLFTDDFERALASHFKTKADLIKPVDRNAMNKLIDGYVRKNLVVKTDGKEQPLVLLGFENDGEATYAYFEVQNLSSVKKIDLTNSLMYDLFDDQSGIMHVIVGGTRKSGKLNYPSKEASFQF